MSFLLDTDICSAYLKSDNQVHSRFIQHGGRLHVSTITAAELNPDVARKFGEVRAYQLDQGLFTPEMDLLIAATALEYNLTLVTHNVQDFANVPGLTVQDWLAP